VIGNGKAAEAGFVCERASDEAFAGTGGSGDDDVVVLTHPLAGGQAEHELAIKAASGAEVDVFHGSGLAKPGTFEAGAQPLVVAHGLFAVDEEAETFLKGESGGRRGGELLPQGGSHAVEPEGFELREGGMVQHEGLSAACRESAQGV
jgi:hypothetical protein